MTEPPEDMKMKFADVLNQTFESGGKVIIPAFAVGRTQMIVYYYHQLYREGLISRLAPIIVDSPLAARATDIYRDHPDTFDPEAAEFNELTGGMLSCKTCEYTQNVQDSKALHNRPGPLIIVSASGMCEAGRIQHHLKNNIGDPRNTVLIVGFQAVNTLGRQLVEKFKRVKIFGDLYDVKARVAVLNGFSSHANAQELMQFIAPLAGRCKKAFLVHGEPDQAEALAAAMNRTGFDNVTIPESGATFDIG
jgi:metallo-beta-lactamase family protein